MRNRVGAFVVAALTVAVAVSPLIASAKPPIHGDPGGPSGNPEWYWYGNVLDWSNNPVVGWIYLEFTAQVLMRPYSIVTLHCQQSYWTGSDGGFEIDPSKDPSVKGNILLDSSIAFRMVVGPMQPGHWCEERIMYLPSSGAVIFRLPTDQPCSVPIAAQFANCAESSISVGQAYQHEYVFHPYECDPVFWPYTNYWYHTANGFPVALSSDSTTGLPVMWSGDFKSTGHFYSRYWDSTVGRYIYGAYWKSTETRIISAGVYGTGESWLSDSWAPFSITRHAGGIDDYVSSPNNVPGIVRTLTAGQVYTSSYSAGGSITTQGSMAVGALLVVGGGSSTVYSTASLTFQYDLRVPYPGGSYTISYSIHCPSDGSHTYKIWADGFVTHIWRLS